MITDLLHHLLLAFIAVAGGLAVGSGLVSLLIVFDLVPRLAQLARGYRQAHIYESALLCGALWFTLADFLDWQSPFELRWLLPLVGLFCGLFVGMLAAALTEVLNVLPILAKRLRLSRFIYALVWALVLGKIIGSLFDWLVYQW